MFTSKLIRDQIPSRILASGKQAAFYQLSLEEFESKVKEKVLEEAAEVSAAKTTPELVEELADLLEVLETLCTIKKLTRREILNCKKQKRRSSGSFSQRYALVMPYEQRKQS